MILLPTNQQVLRRLCILPLNADENPRKTIYFAIFAFILFAINFMTLVGSVVFFAKNIHADLEEALYAVFQIAGCTGLTYLCLAAFFLRNEITQFLETLSEIYSARKKFIYKIQTHLFLF